MALKRPEARQKEAEKERKAKEGFFFALPGSRERKSSLAGWNGLEAAHTKTIRDHSSTSKGAIEYVIVTVRDFQGPLF